MRRNRVVRVLMFAPVAIVALAVFGFVVMSLWNWLMPLLFGLRAITYWQAFGVLILSRILFGGLGGRPGHRARQRIWERMTPEQREKFRDGMRHRCGEFGEKATEG
ncbi:MAG TPA: hypothetical protein VLC46_14210 [Thermoanaerobaculia bacterium]|jgi:hypothetical protein|nr:hypothetical protein [Thermoanaerobaculia bacterium]